MTEIPRRFSLVSQVAEILRRELHRGEWKDWLPGERALCDRFQVSRITVRSALDVLRREGMVAVSKGRRRRIVAIPKAHAPPDESNVIGLVAATPYHALSSFSLYLIGELQRHLRDAGYQLAVHAHPHFSGPRWATELEALVNRTRAKCWVLLAGLDRAERWFVERKLRAIVVGLPSEGIALPHLGTDYAAVCRHAVGMFISKGHRRVGLVITGPKDAARNPCAKGFLEGFPSRAECEQAQSRLTCHDGTVKGVCSAVQTLFRSATPPSGLIVARPKHVLTVLTELHRLGFRVPQEVSIISLGHDPFLDNVVPAVAHYEFNWAAFVRRLFRMVLRLATTGAGSLRGLLVMQEFRLGETLLRK